MRLYLVRHGEAVETADGRRALSDAGRRQVEAVAAALARAGVGVGRVEHSGKERAQQTAEILAATLAGGAVAARAGISPMAPVTPFVAQARALGDDLMVVGHLPFMSNAVRALVSGEGHDREVVVMPTAAVVCLETVDGGERWTVAWMITPELFG